MLFNIFISDLEANIKSLLVVGIFADDTRRGRIVNNEKAGSCTGPSGLLGKLGSAKQNPLNYRQKQSDTAWKQEIQVMQQNWKLHPRQ